MKKTIKKTPSLKKELQNAYIALMEILPAILQYGYVTSMCSTIDNTILVRIVLYDGRKASIEIEDSQHMGGFYSEIENSIDSKVFCDFTTTSFDTWIKQP